MTKLNILDFDTRLESNYDEVRYNFEQELIEHCKRPMPRFQRMGRTDSFAYKEHAVLLSFLERPYLPF